MKSVKMMKCSLELLKWRKLNCPSSQWFQRTFHHLDWFTMYTKLFLCLCVTHALLCIMILSVTDLAYLSICRAVILVRVYIHILCILLVTSLAEHSFSFFTFFCLWILCMGIFVFSCSDFNWFWLTSLARHINRVLVTTCLWSVICSTLVVSIISICSIFCFIL